MCWCRAYAHSSGGLNHLNGWKDPFARFRPIPAAKTSLPGLSSKPLQASPRAWSKPGGHTKEAPRNAGP
ncbi:hypothetical protein GCM10023224_04810 [Streptomonospora halophila]|uniref:Uncharacterized protein n=1 Tax=Streptomonospora halophila TaxID=427369 RepID=A0ABP9G8C6_9ACTN